MRLLSTTTFLLEEFSGKNIPKYAILSHRWEDEEVTFQDLQKVQTLTDIKKKGIGKIMGCLKTAASYGCDWVWIDSCCIDKTSSAELSEAINSMFSWYQKAEICLTYLSDVLPGVLSDPRGDYGGQELSFRRSKWWTRGWTLQELLAPRHLMFIDRYWGSIGTRNDLSKMVSQITGIDGPHLKNPRAASVAQIMSWASKRETTRTEDMAYSLMGLFGVYMPPLYGEGENAFIRLQLEIIKISDDESIFAWSDSSNRGGGLLAQHPAAFKQCGSIIQYESDPEKPEFSMTNKGLRIEAHIYSSTDPDSSIQRVDDAIIVFLNCCDINRDEGSPGNLGIYLKWIEGNQFARICAGMLAYEMPDSQIRLDKRQILYVKQRRFDDCPIRGPFNFLIKYKSFPEGFSMRYYVSDNGRIQWIPRGQGKAHEADELLVDRFIGSGFVVALAIANEKAEGFTMILNYLDNHVPEIELLDHANHAALDGLVRANKYEKYSYQNFASMIWDYSFVSADMKRLEDTTDMHTERYEIHISVEPYVGQTCEFSKW